MELIPRNQADKIINAFFDPLTTEADKIKAAEENRENLLVKYIGEEVAKRAKRIIDAEWPNIVQKINSAIERKEQRVVVFKFRTLDLKPCDAYLKDDIFVEPWIESRANYVAVAEFQSRVKAAGYEMSGPNGPCRRSDGPGFFRAVFGGGADATWCHKESTVFIHNRMPGK